MPYCIYTDIYKGKLTIYDLIFTSAKGGGNVTFVCLSDLLVNKL